MRITKTAIAYFVFIAAFSSACWANFSVTYDFSNPVGDAGGGGGCSGDFYISREIKPQKNAIGGLVPVGIFVRDSRCGDGPVEISLDNRAYLIEPIGEPKLGFASAYQNAKEGIKVTIEPVKVIKEIYDKDTECTSYFRLVTITIHYKGTKKKFNGIVGGGCP